MSVANSCLGFGRESDVETARACDIIIDTKPLFGHCAIVTGNFNMRSSAIPSGSGVIHATAVGVVDGMWGNGKAYCYRATSLTRAEAAKIDKVAREIYFGANYSIGRAVFKSWSGSSTFGDSAQERLEKYRTRMENHQGVLKNVYCSELVTVAYQLGLNIDRSNNSWIDLDGKHTLPSTLKSWLDRNATNWRCMGTITDSSLALS